MIPDYYFNDIYEITPDFLHSIKIDTIVCDIDNTLVTYGDPLPTESVKKWISDMEKSKIKFVFLSNNHPPRVEKFAGSLSIPYFAEAKKPGTKVLKNALDKVGADKSHTASLGDQIFTDMLAGKRAGLVTILVPPIDDRTDLLHRIKRLGEYPCMKRFFGHHAGRDAEFENWKNLTVRKNKRSKVQK